MAQSGQKHVAVVGAGFGGLQFCQHFHSPAARVTLIDRTNHHLFQPLLYQVATAGLSAPDIAQPVRSILSNRPNVTVLMDEVSDVKLAEKKVVLRESELAYDYLVLAVGSRTAYYGHREWEQCAPGLKTLEDAVRIRSRILMAFEKAETEAAEEERERLMTIVVVGGGPTGVELAGAFAELARRVLKADFRHIDPSRARVILIEGGPRILSTFSPAVSASGARQLGALGVSVRTGVRVRNITEGRVDLDNGETIEAANIIWAAGVSASPLAKKLGVPLDNAGRVKVNPDLSLPGHPEVFAVGDLATLIDANGKPVPGLAPAAMQMGRHVAKIVEAEIASPGAKHPPFKYFDKGNMATIGRSAAVAQVGKFEFSGFIAWLAWLFIHLLFLVGFRNKVAVVFNWFYSYVFYKRGARIISNSMEPAPKLAPAPTPVEMAN